MTAVVIIDPTLNGSSVNSNYTTPGSLLNLGVPVGQSPGSTTGTLGSTGGVTTYSGDTYTIIAANTIQDATDGELCGFFTGTGAAVIIPVGFQATKVEVINLTDGIQWNWRYGFTATDTLKTTDGTPAIATDTGSAITVTSDKAGNTIVALSATLAVSAKLLCFRIEG